MAISIEAREVSQKFGIRFSREVNNLASRALSLGLDPSNILERAAKIAQEDGKTKAGMFGLPGKYLRKNLSGLLEDHRTNTVFERPRRR